MEDEISYAARYGAEFTTAFVLGYISGYGRDEFVGRPENTKCWEDIREKYPLENDYSSDMFSYLADNSSRKNEALKFLTASMSYPVTELAFTDLDPEDQAIIFSGFYAGFTAQEADWKDIREVLS